MDLTRKALQAAINGACAGGGMGQAMNCDIRFAASDATFSTAFARRGLIAEWGISWALPRVVGQGAAMDLLLSARKFKGDEAKDRRFLEDGISLSAGWFPLACTDVPSVDQLGELQKLRGGAGDSALDPPKYWGQVKDPLRA